MAIFSYKGLDKSGSEVKGTINSEGVNAAKARVKSMGIMLIEINEQTSSSLKKGAGFTFGSAVNINDLALMTRQLATLLRAKIQVVEAFTALVDQTDNPTLKTALSEIRQKVNEGSTLSKAMSDYPKIFDNVYINMVDAGETSGTLEVVLLKLADFTESQLKLKNKIKGAITYPLIMMTAGSAMIGVIFVFVIPQLTKVFVSMKKTLPLQTRICIWISNFLIHYWWLVIIMAFVAYTATKKYIATPAGKSKFDSAILKFPVLSEIVTMINASRFCSTLATLLQAGVPILVSMKIVSNLISNVHMKKAIDDSRQSVSEGASLTGPLIRSELFPSMMTHMIKLGEKSGELEPMLKIVSETYEDQVNTKLTGLTSVLEPIMMVMMGGVVGFIIFSVVVPLLDLNKMGH
ncbi:MAG: type II secretion system inner membrane protein GspF [Bdellovibrionales bacterium]|nr:type II secretion system inner membrane protein GspF [Bdellovibrionales bacterium]